jgi:transcription termination/antitermination protein NusG
VEEPDRFADNATPQGDAAPAAQAAEHPVAPGEASMVPAEHSRPDIERRETAADTASADTDSSQSVAKIEAAEQAAYEGTDDADDDEGFVGPAEPLEFIDESVPDEDLKFDWYILKVAVNREDSIKEALLRRVKMNGLEKYFQDVVVPTEDVKEFTKTGKPRVVKKKLYPGYILINMSINDESWFVVRETPGIGDFTGAGGKPSPMAQKDVDRILKLSRPVEEGQQSAVKTAIPFKKGDRVRVKEGYFQNFEGDVDVIDEANGRVTVLVNIFGRSAPVELDHWQIENV